MRPAEKIEKFMKNVPLETSARRDKEILDDALRALKESKEGDKRQPNIWRIIMKSRMTKPAVVAVIGLVIIIGIIEIGKPAGRASAVFAAAMDSVREAGTFSCTEIFEASYEDGGVDGTYLLKQRLMFKEPDWERREQLTSPWPKYIGEITITDYNTRRRLILRPTERTATLYDVSSEYRIDEETDELELTQLNTRIRDRLLEWSAEAVEDLGIVKLDGQSVRLLRSRKNKRITTVWIDPETNYPVQIELKWTENGRSPVMFTSIRIDAELDDELFSLEPPEDYTLVVHDEAVPDYKSKMMTKIKYLGLWCVVYANDNGDQFPGELSDLVNFGVITQEQLSKALAPPDDPAGLPAIRYVKPNLDGKEWSNTIILHENYDQWPEDGVVAGFADGHCELIADQNRFEEMIK